MTAWTVELSEFGLQYEPRGPIKAQCLVDFVSELSQVKTPEEGSEWQLFVDGSSYVKGSGAGIILQGPEGIILEQDLKFDFPTSNNQAEYEALIAGLSLAKEVGAKQLKVCSDSQLVTNQVNGEFQTRDPHLTRYMSKVKSLIMKFDESSIEHIGREKNIRTDLLSKLASSKRMGKNRSVIQETVSNLSIQPEDVLIINNTDKAWMEPIWQFLVNNKVPEYKAEAKRLTRQASYYTIDNGQLYRRGFSSPLLKCLHPA